MKNEGLTTARYHIQRKGYTDDQPITAHPVDKWQAEADGSILAAVTGTGAIRENILVTNTKDGIILYIDSQSGTVRHQSQVNEVPENMPIIAGKNLYQSAGKTKAIKEQDPTYYLEITPVHESDAGQTVTLTYMEGR